MTTADGVVFLVDCDNTLLDNDRVQDDLRDHLAREFGLPSQSQRVIRCDRPLQLSMLGFVLVAIAAFYRG